MTYTTEDAANRLVQAERTGCQHAIDSAKAYLSYYQHQAGTTAATQREATRLDAIGPAGREYERCTAACSPTL
jgi:hypothetical protein